VLTRPHEADSALRGRLTVCPNRKGGFAAGAGSMITAAVPLGLLVASWFRDRQVFPILLAALTTMVIAAPIYVVMNFSVNGVYFSPDFRYGLSVLPFFAAAVAAGLRTRISGAVLSGLALLGMVTQLVALF